MNKTNRRPSASFARVLLATFFLSLCGAREVLAQTRLVSPVLRASLPVSPLAPSANSLSLPSPLSGARLTAAPGLAGPSALTPTLVAPLQPSLMPMGGPVSVAPAAARAALVDAASLGSIAPGFVFDGERSRAAAPSALATSLSAASSDLVPAEATPEQVEKMRLALSTLFTPGAVLGADNMADAALSARVPVAMGINALWKLAEEGQIMRVWTGGTYWYIYAHALQRAKTPSDDPALEQGHAQTLAAIKLANAVGTYPQAQALVELGKALNSFAFADAQEARAEATILYKNLALTFSHNVVNEHVANLAKLRKEEPPQEADLARNSIRNAFASGTTDPNSLDATGRKWMVDLLDALHPTEELMGTTKGRTVSAGLSMVLSYLKGEPLPGDDINALAPKDRKRALFPLIVKNEFKAIGAFGTNLTRMAVEGTLTPTIGRLSETEEMIDTLLRRKKNNPIVVGEGGVGKT
ncbi:MAG: hypothetical protein HYZ74_05745, partial [Elusimicrobia bacterium]|nr:hypothetical protein [Elusimicrobiota bacterium]